MRKLVNTENITLDGSIEMLGEWFDPQGQGDMSDLMEEIHRQDAEADALLIGRQTFEDLRGYWPQQTDDKTGITDYLNNVDKYVVSSTMTDPDWQNSTVLSGDPVEKGARPQGAHRQRHRADREHHPGPRSHRGRTGRRVPPVRLPRGARARSSAVPRRLRDPAPQACGHAVFRVWDHPARLRSAGLRPSPDAAVRVPKAREPFTTKSFHPEMRRGHAQTAPDECPQPDGQRGVLPVSADQCRSSPKVTVRAIRVFFATTSPDC